jgi:hypothetical protein
MVSQHNFVRSIPKYPILRVQISTDLQQFFSHLLKKQLNLAGVLQVELAQKNHVLVVWQHLAKILNHLFVPLLATVVENNVYGLISDTLEVQLWPDRIFELIKAFLLVKKGTSSR